jgi:hypothetical protein
MIFPARGLQVSHRLEQPRFVADACHEREHPSIQDVRHSPREALHFLLVEFGHLISPAALIYRGVTFAVQRLAAKLQPALSLPWAIHPGEP